MLQAFTGATLDDQVAVCKGTTAEWTCECPVAEECLVDFVDKTINVTGMNDAYDNQIVRGGLKPAELLKLCQRVRKLKIEGNGHGDTDRQVAQAS